MVKKRHYLVPARLTAKLPVLRSLSWLLEAFIVRSLVALIRVLPPEHALRFAAGVFRILKPVFPFADKIRHNLRIAFPQQDAREIERMTRNSCGNLGVAAAELVFASRIWAERDRRIQFVLEDGVNLADYRGRPVVMVTGHIGAWQIGAFIAPQYQLHITSIYAPEGNPYLRGFLERLRAELPINFVARDGCMRTLTKELRLGHVVGLASDTRLDSGDMIPFFGIPAPTNTTAARLAIRHNCDFFPVRVERLPGMKYRITLCKAIRAGDPAASTAGKARQMTEELLQHFEAWIREAPDQWMCFGRRWPMEVYANRAGRTAPKHDVAH